MAEKSLEQYIQELADALKSNEALVAENSSLKDELEAAEKEAADNLELAKLLEKKAEETSIQVELLEKLLEDSSEEKPEHIFEYQDRKYQVLVPKVLIPGVGERSALEILSCDESKKQLVKSNSGFIKELA
jgi:5'-3' exonuclease